MEKDLNVERPAEAEKTIQEEVEAKVTRKPSRKLFGTFSGVFTPTLLTILGVILYLREGWVVGNAGLLGAWLIIIISFAITFFTALSLSSITTNIRLGAGGAFSVISQSLGLEVGGSVGIPLYLAQALAVAMYIFGFRAGWLWIFPDHPPLLVDLGTFALLFVIAFISASLAFKVQYLILAAIIVSLIAVGASVFTQSMDNPIRWWGTFPGSPETGFQGIGFWGVFAVFFPASIGIMAGANMSGDLKNPRRSIPVGTLSAIGLSFIVYLILAIWLAMSASNASLLNNYSVMIEKAAWGPAVLAGLLGATFSSALSSLVGSPRILQALAEHKILPGSAWFAVRTAKGEPRNAMLLTGAIVLLALMLRNLNAIAPLITMFFLITYATINGVVLIEQSLKLVSFRPLLRIPRLVSALGCAGCLFAMFIVNAIFAIVAMAVVIALHAYLIKKRIKAPFGDVRSGLFTALAEWGAKKAEDLGGSREKVWKANLLVPVEDSREVRNVYLLLKDMARPKGFVRLLGLTGERNLEELTENLPVLVEDFKDEDVFSTWTVIDIDAATFSENLVVGLQALGSAFFRSSVIFLPFPQESEQEAKIQRIVRNAKRYELGAVLFHGEKLEEREDKMVHLIIDRPESGWKISVDLGRFDLALLLAYKLKHNWRSKIILTALTESGEDREAQDFIDSVVELARIPNVQSRMAHSKEELRPPDREAPFVTLRSIQKDLDFEALRETIEIVQTPCLFVMDSSLENALI
ncbi:MAG: amino acid permease [Desulfobacteraceae bacterium]|jgi:solute carrier family 12 sodium/potassium/chloride transporter 2|nr:amino acid permease [Desulfobacteraceae bacterium]